MARRSPSSGCKHTTILLIAGLDTVANTFGFIARFLADHPEHRKWIRDNPRRLDNAREEMLRRFPVVIAGTARLCVEPAQVGPAPVAANDQIIAVPAMMNFDEATFPDPLGQISNVACPPPAHSARARINAWAPPSPACS